MMPNTQKSTKISDMKKKPFTFEELVLHFRMHFRMQSTLECKAL